VYLTVLVTLLMRCRAELPILVFTDIADTDIADIFLADTGTDIPDNRYFLGR